LNVNPFVNPGAYYINAGLAFFANFRTSNGANPTPVLVQTGGTFNAQTEQLSGGIMIVRGGTHTNSGSLSLGPSSLTYGGGSLTTGSLSLIGAKNLTFEIDPDHLFSPFTITGFGSTLLSGNLHLALPNGAAGKISGTDQFTLMTTTTSSNTFFSGFNNV